MDIHVLVLLLLAFVVGALLFTLLRMGRTGSSFANRITKDSAAGMQRSFEVLRPCPVCHAMLKKGETVHSVVFGSRNEDTITHIYGCRYCYPANESNVRKCPVCKQELPADGYLVARMFERQIENGKEKKAKRHVHVLGCTECRNRNSRPAASGIKNG